MPFARKWFAWPCALAVAIAAGSCFTKLGDCISQGVSVDPCFTSVHMPGNTTLNARNLQDLGAAIDTWELQGVASQFAPVVDGNRLSLTPIGYVPGSFRVRAWSGVNYGESVLTLSGQNFGFRPVPVQLSGSIAPPSEHLLAIAATSAHGPQQPQLAASSFDGYYMAYAYNPDAGGGPGSTGSDNYVVRQFRASSDQMTAEIGGQFLGFLQPGNPARPNIATDCQGNGYWVDWIDATHPVMRRLDPAGILSPDQPMGQFASIGPLAAACDGSLYFLGDDCGECPGLWRIAAFGGLPEQVVIPGLPDVGTQYKSLAVDPQSRLLLGARADASPLPESRIVRVVFDGSAVTLDPTFHFELGSVPDLFDSIDFLSVDDNEGIYAAVSRMGGDPPHSIAPRIIGINTDGLALLTIDRYDYTCPEGEDETSGPLRFRSIQSLCATSEGSLYVAVDLDPELHPRTECPGLRVVLLQR